MFLCTSTNNRTGCCNDEYDRLILEVAPSQSSHEQRLKLFQQAATTLLPDIPIIPVYTYTSIKLLHPSVRNFDDNILNQAMYKDLYLDANL